MMELLDRPVTTEAKQEGILSPDLLEAAGIPPDTFLFDYEGYLKWYEERYEKELEGLKCIIDSVSEAHDPKFYAKLNDEYSKLADRTSQERGEKFDKDLIDLIQALLITIPKHEDGGMAKKHITFAIRPGTDLYWYDQLMKEITGLPPDQDTYYTDDYDKEEQYRKYWPNHPGRPDKASIEVHVYELPAVTNKIGEIAVLQVIKMSQGKDEDDSKDEAA